MSDSINNTNIKGVWIFVVFGFASLGLLIGSIAGLSSADLTITLFGLLFAFAGGSIIAFMGKIPKSSIGLASIALTSFCLAAIISLYVGLFIKVNETLFVRNEQITSSNPESSKTIVHNNKVTRQSYQDLMRASEGQKLKDYLKDEVTFGRLDISVACKMLDESIRKEGILSND